MFVMGDEIGRSQQGNNNAYCIDSALTWLDWNLMESNKQLHDFVAALNRFRLQHPCLRVNRFDAPANSLGLPSSSFHGTAAWSPNWSDDSRQLAWMFSGEQSIDAASSAQPDAVYVIANMAHYASWFDLPQLPNDLKWRVAFNTGDRNQPVLSTPYPLDGQGILAGERSVVILTI